MQLFKITSKGTLIGHSKLEFGDPPMGVSHGHFLPSMAYSEIQSKVIGSYGNQEHLELRASTEAGVPIPCIAVAIDDHSKDIGPSEIYVELLGIPYPDYEGFFPHHVALYEKRFPPAP